MNLEAKVMSLFDAPRGSLLVHACNCKGVWGSGIAAEFKKRFPKAFEQYNRLCLDGQQTLLGKAFVFEEDGYYIGCLMTSDDYGRRVDKPHHILTNTDRALHNLLSKFNNSIPVYSNKFNSGLFNVPWESTEDILKYHVEFGNLNWTVCEVV